MAGERVQINGQWYPIADLDRPLLIAIAEKAVEQLQLTVVPPGHYSSPIPGKDDVEQYLARQSGTPPSLPGIALDLAGQLERIASFAPFARDYDPPAQPDGRRRYYTENEFFGGSDAFVMEALLRSLQPRRVVEIGTGFSSALMLDVRERYCVEPFDVTFIDMHPATLRRLVPVDEPLMQVLEQPAETCDLAIFRALTAGDILSIDSSHVLRAGNDLMFVLWDVLPVLEPGVWVHFHDIYYPFEYPADMLRRGVFYNEAYLLRAFLTDNAAWTIELFLSYLEAVAPGHLSKLHPLCGSASSLWLRKVGFGGHEAARS